MATAQIPEKPAEDRSAYAGVLRYYELAKRAEWQVRDLPWDEMPPIPEYKGSPRKLARRRDLWRSVVTQQLQADELAVEMATQLFRMAPEPEAKLYYTTMVQDESRHTEAWLRLVEEAGGRGEPDPYLDQLAEMQLKAESIEEKVVNMQVFYERLIIPRFRLIARSSKGTVLEDLCNRLTVDDGIHHGSGMAYAKVLITNAPEKTKRTIMEASNRMLPIFTQHALWRPKARERVGAHARHGCPPPARRPGHRRPPRPVARPRRQGRRNPVLSNSPRSRWPRRNDPKSIRARQEQLGYLYLRGESRTNLPPYGLSDVLGGSHEARREIVLVEGVMDLHQLRAHGVENVAALGGLGIGPKTFGRLSHLGVERVTFCFDRDEPGRSAAARAIE